MIARPEPSARPLALAAVPADLARSDDAELVRALRANEPWAAPALWNKHAPRVYRLAARMLGSSDDAEDITQEVLARVFAKIDQINDPGALGSFVFSIALRTLKWTLRRRRVRHVLQLSTTGRRPEQRVEPVDSEGREALARLYAILDQLSAQERSAFVLRHLETMSLPEMAEAMGLSLATVKRRLHRATARVSWFVDRDATLAAYRTETKKEPHET
jgi:RNA polymerase sigma-70 factor (ECF subfamily)